MNILYSKSQLSFTLCFPQVVSFLRVDDHFREFFRYIVLGKESVSDPKVYECGLKNLRYVLTLTEIEWDWVRLSEIEWDWERLSEIEWDRLTLSEIEWNWLILTDIDWDWVRLSEIDCNWLRLTDIDWLLIWLKLRPNSPVPCLNNCTQQILRVSKV